MFNNKAIYDTPLLQREKTRELLLINIGFEFLFSVKNQLNNQQ